MFHCVLCVVLPLRSAVQRVTHQQQPVGLLPLIQNAWPFTGSSSVVVTCRESIGETTKTTPPGVPCIYPVLPLHTVVIYMYIYTIYMYMYTTVQ